MTDEPRDLMTPVRTPLFLIGVLLVLLGTFMLFVLGGMTYIVVTAPQDITIIQFVLEHVRAGDAAIYGNMTDIASGRKMSFEVNWSESVRTVTFLFLGVALLAVLAGILKVLISSGIGIIRLAAGASDKK